MKTIREELPGDNWVELIDPDELTSKHHRKVQNYVRSASENALSYVIAQRDAILFNCVDRWSFSAPVPTDEAALNKLALPFKPYKALCRVLEQYAENLRLSADDDEDDAETPPEPSDN